MPLVEAEFPLRIGLADAGREGLYHLQRLALRSDCAILGVCAPAEGQTYLPSGFPGRQYPSFHALLADPEIDAVLLAGSLSTRVESARAALRAKKHLLIPAPLCLNTCDAQQVLEEAIRLGRSVAVLHPRRWDGDFRTAEAFTHSGAAGAIMAARLFERQYGRTEDPVSQGQGADEGNAGSGDLLLRFGCHLFDQLLRLIPSPVKRVFARLGGDEVAATDEFTTLFEFDGGALAHVEISLHSFAPLQTGWILEGARGGYREGIWYRATAEGEVIDVAVERQSSDLDAPYTEAIRALCAPHTITASAQAAVRVLALIDAARSSAGTGEWVAVPRQ